MGEPIKLSDELVLDARLSAEIEERSIGGQIEFWARLGKAIEPLLQGRPALALRQAGAMTPLSQCLATVDSSQGGRRIMEYLAAKPFPHYEPAAGSAGLLVRIDADGTRTTGRFVDREFQAVE